MGYKRQYRLAKFVLFIVAFPIFFKTILAFWMRWLPNFHGSLKDLALPFCDQGEALGSSTKGLVEPLKAVGNKGNAGLGWDNSRRGNV